MFKKKSLDYHKSPVKAQQHKIVDILQDFENQILGSNLQFSSAHGMKEQIKPLIQQCKILLFSTTNYEQEAVKLLQKQQTKGMCAKPLFFGDIIWECFDCQIQPLCIQCEECFEKTDHTGHKVIMHKNLNGSCDCGDANNWKPSGNCSDHQGTKESIQASMKNIDQNILINSGYVIQYLVQSIKKHCLILQKDPSNQFLQSMIYMLCDFFIWMIDLSPAFIQITEDVIRNQVDDSESFLRLNKSLNHKCGVYLQINVELTPFKADQNSLNLTRFKDMCYCNMFDLLAQVNHLFDKDAQKVMYTLGLKFIQSDYFRILVGLSLFRSYEEIQTHRNDDSSFGNLFIQFYASDYSQYQTLKYPQIREIIIGTINKLIKQFVLNQTKEKMSPLTYCYTDLIKMTQPITAEMLIQNTDFILQLIDHLQEYYFLDLTKYQTTHVTYEHQFERKLYHQASGKVCQVLSCYLDRVDPFDISLNRKIMQRFMLNFTLIDQKVSKVEEDQAFALIPLHNAFSRYFTRLVMQNYLIEVKEDNYLSSKDLMISIAFRFLNSSCEDEDRQRLIAIILKPLTISWTFIHEIASNKWVMCGQKIKQSYYYLYNYNSTIYYNIALYQILISVSPIPGQIIEGIMNIQQRDQWMKVTMNHLKEPSAMSESYLNHIQANFDEKKLSQMIYFQLRQLITICVNELPILYNLVDFEVSPMIQDEVKMMFEKDIKRSLVHSMMIQGLRSDIEKIRQCTLLIYEQSPSFEKILREITEQTRDNNTGKMIFKIKNELLNQFDPYFYVIPEDQEKAYEIINSLQQEKKFVDANIGDTFENYQYSSQINQLASESLINPHLIEYLSNLMEEWIVDSRKLQKVQVLNDKIGNQCLKLFLIIFKAANNSQQIELQSTLIQIILALPQFQGVLEAIGKKNQQYQIIVQKIIKELNKLKGEEDQIMMDLSNSQTAADDQKKLQRDQAKLKQQEIMKKFQNKRNNFANQVQEESKQQEETKSQSSYNNQQTIKQCSFCLEELQDSKYINQPFGRFAYFTQTQILFQSIKQAMSRNKDRICYDNGQYDEILKLLGLNILENSTYTSDTILRCNHYAHDSCLQYYLESNQQGQYTQQQRNYIGISMDQFYCPLCKSLCNMLLPDNDLSEVLTLIRSQHDSHKFASVLNFSNVINMKISSKLKLDEDTDDQGQIQLDSVLNFFIQNIMLLKIDKVQQNFFNSQYSNEILINFDDLNLLLRMSLNFTQIVTKIRELGDNSKKVNLKQEYSQLINNRINKELLELENGFVYLKDLTLVSMRIILLLVIDQQSTENELNKSISFILTALSDHALVQQNLISKKQGQSSQANCYIHDNFLKLNAYMLLAITNKNSKFQDSWMKKNQKLLSLLSKNQCDIESFKAYLGLSNNYEDQFGRTNQESITNLQQYLAFGSIADDEYQKNSIDCYQAFYNSVYAQNKNLIDYSQNYLTKINLPFEFIQIPHNFQQFVLKYYKQKCDRCKKVPENGAVCLLCGQVLCMKTDCCQINSIAELTHHSRDFEGGVGVYIWIQGGYMYLIENGRVIQKSCPYVNQYGESFQQNKSKDWDQFTLTGEQAAHSSSSLSENYCGSYCQTGIIDKIKKQYIELRIANEVIKQRQINQLNIRIGSI
ncbi:zinc finger family protein [Stylonychia lemnae]|uniref:E3 ubiquitin-protein ligase n=1 Tax=Stylonychia lemnae TaxID=5949 RepID=A0A078A3Y1_STYLE|nr:zinc finger family protein [Stylonychia lemnae]|eukprot:CDW76233.1 zinc finger family protein [Stylonychia lemnae]